MGKNLISENFTECTSALGKQVSEICDARQALSSAVCTENGTEFPDETAKSTYNSISQMFTTMYNDNVNNQISLGKTKSILYKNDENHSNNILEICSELEGIKNAAEELASKTISNTNSSYIEIEDIVSLLPDDRIRAFQSGNPWISEDFQYLYFNGEAYKIVLSPYQSVDPNPPMCDGPYFAAGPSLVHTKEFNGDYFDFADAIAGMNQMSIDDMAGAMGSNYQVAPNTSMIPDTKLGTLFDVFGLAAKFVDAGQKDLSVTANFYQAGDERRVVLGVDFSDYNDAIQAYAGGEVSYLGRCQDGAGELKVSSGVRDIYEEVTGEKGTNGHMYDLVISVDEFHLQDEYHMTLYFDENGNMMAHTNVYEGDSVKIVEKSGLFYMNSEVVYEQTPSSESQVDPKIASVLYGAIETGFN